MVLELYHIKSNERQDFNSGGSSSVRQDTPLPIDQNSLDELERTPGTAAVSGTYGREPAGRRGIKPALPESPETNPFPFPEIVYPYLDVGDNVHANVCTWLDTNCGTTNSRWFIPGTCENGHRIAKVIACGKEWCPVCGQKGSIAHNRRYVRWLTKIMQFRRMRYICFTIPEHLRANYRTKETMKELGRRAQELLKAHGYPRGLRRWHYFGDRSHKWHPHLNVLVEGGYMNKATVESIKRGWAEILGTDVVSVKMGYKQRPGDMVGSLFYVTRATFLDYNWDIDMALELRNFRNMVVWGRDWGQEPVWDVDKIDRTDVDTGEIINVGAIEKIVNGACHICGAAIHWDNALPAKFLDLVDKESLGAGYYRIIDRPPPRETPEPYMLTWRRRLIDMSGRPSKRLSPQFLARHREFAEQRELDRLADQVREDLWREILRQGKR